MSTSPSNQKVSAYESATISTLVASIKAEKFQKQWPNYISYIRFPNFKNLATNARVDFSFPLVALVGPNGSGKTSVIHALYGAPFRRSVSDFWFSTPLDPIVSRQENPPRFIYGYIHPVIGKSVETRKARVGQDRDYWEPTKEVIEDGMTMGYSSFPLPDGRATDRWNPVKRKVLYLNFRAELSAFDKYFYFGTLKQTATLRSKQDRLRRWSSLLVTAFQKGKNAAQKHKNKQTIYPVHKLYKLNDVELSAVRYVLGKEYQSAEIIDHSVYDNVRGLGVRFVSKNGQKYSEAFAGSGEMAVVSLISQLFQAQDGTLIVLDEPEVSLHPGAQDRLLEVILARTLKCKHQVVFSTHSPAMVRHLPSEAIKVFIENTDGKFEVVQNVTAQTAFSHLGEPLQNKINIYVEDRLAKLLIQFVIKKIFNESVAKGIRVEYLTGGASAYYGLRIPTLMQSQEHIYFLFDGDSAPKDGFPDPAAIAPNKYDEEIKKCTSVEKIQYGLNGGNDPSLQQQKQDLQKKYLTFIRDRVYFLPCFTPEQLILEVLTENTSETKNMKAKAELNSYVELNLGIAGSFEETQIAAITLFAHAVKSKPDLAQFRHIAESLNNIVGKVQSI